MRWLVDEPCSLSSCDTYILPPPHTNSSTYYVLFQLHLDPIIRGFIYYSFVGKLQHLLALLFPFMIMKNCEAQSVITRCAVGAPSCSWLRCNLLTKGFHGVTFLSQRKRQEICCHIVPNDPPPHLTRSIVEHEKLMEISGWQIGEHTRVTEADSEK